MPGVWPTCSLVWDGSGMVLIAKRLEGGKFAWPAVTDGVMKLSPAHLSALFEGARLAARACPPGPAPGDCGIAAAE